MNHYFGLFVLLSVLVSGTLVFPSSFADDHMSGTENNGTSTNSTSTEENVSVDDEMEFETTGEEVMEEEVMEEEVMEEEVMEEEVMEEEIPVVLSPLKQIKEGIAPENIVCKEGLELVFKISGQPACIQSTSVEKLIAWGWAQ